MNTKSYSPSSFPSRMVWHVLLGFSLYWIGNVLVIFPWLLSKIFGIITMFLSTILWGYIAYFCFKHAPRKDWNKDTLSMSLSFMITAVIQDYFLYGLYRGVPDELYEFTTFLAYAMVFLIPFVVRFVFLKKYESQTIKKVSIKKMVMTFSIGLFSMLLTLWSVKFW